MKIEDIACPTWGLSDPFYTDCDGSSYLTATEGPPYNPVILVPTQFLNYDPVWGKCLDVPSDGPFLLPCGLYDPPRALHTATAMAPDPTPASDPPAATPPAALPQVAPAPNVAQHTASPPPAQPNNDPGPGSNQDSGQGGGDSHGENAPNQHQAPAPDKAGQGSNQDPSQDRNNGHGDNAPKQQQISAPINAGPGSNQDPSSGQDNPKGAAAPDQQQAPAPNNAGPASTQHQSQSLDSPNGATAPNQQEAPASNSPGSDSKDHPAGTSGQGPTNPNGDLDSGQHQNSDQKQGNSQAPPSAETNQNPASNGMGQSGNNQPVSAQAPSESNPQNAAPVPQPIAHTTINIGNPQPSPELGGIINNALNNGPPALAGQQNSGGNSAGGAQGGPGGNPESNSETGQGGEESQSVGQGGNVPASPPPFTPHPITVLGQTLNALNPSEVAVAGAGKILSAGGPAYTADGKFFSVGPSGKVVAGTLAPGPTPAAVLTFGSAVYTANSASKFVIAGQTLAPNAQITVSGTPIALPSGSSNIAVVGSSTQSLSFVTPAPGNGPAILTFGGSTYSANTASQFIIGGQTLNPGAAITISGTPISLAPIGGPSVAIIGASTQVLGNAGVASQSPGLLTFNGATYTANSASQFIVGTETLTPGGQITVFGMPISEGSDGSFVVIGGSTQPLATPGPTQAPTLLTFNGQTFTANSASEFVIFGQTLSPGSQITVSGTPISEAASGTGLVVIGSSTEVLGHAASGIATAPVTSSAMAFIGAGADFKIPSPFWPLLGWLAILLISGVLFLG